MSLTSTVGLPTGALPTLYNAAGQPVSGLRQGNGGALLYTLNPGTYVVQRERVDGQSQAATVQYNLTLTLLASGGDR